MKKTLGVRAIAAAVLALAPLTAAFAGTVDFGRTDIKAPMNGMAVFNDAYNFTLGADAWLSGQIVTQPAGTNQPWINIQSAYLTKAGDPTHIDLVETDGIVWFSQAKPFGVETWTLAMQWLSAGDWTMHVSGQGYSSKSFEGYAGRLTVPEPAGLGLAVLALASLAFARRRTARGHV